MTTEKIQNPHNEKRVVWGTLYPTGVSTCKDGLGGVELAAPYPAGAHKMRRSFTRLQILAFAVIVVFQSQAQTGDAIFPKGELSTVKNHTGNIWLKELNVGDSTFDSSIAIATYDAGAKLDWHIHPGGQVLLITEGSGYYQERGKPLQVVHKGDVIKCLPGVEHWHGASPKSGFAYIAVTPTQKGKTIWLEPVSDKDYNGGR